MMAPHIALVVPVYNHGPALDGFLPRLAAQGLPIFLVDDGSAPETAAILDRLAAREGVTLVRRAENGGKGAAVMSGCRAAFEAGFTHALQIDADGQHRAEDIPKFLAAAAAQPAALILAKPVYGAEASKGRLYGRQITRFWIWVETLSFAIGDAMVGFRVYPLADIVAVADGVTLGRRMDFDPEIAVRLFWRGLKVVNIETPVAYIEGGHSNFRMFRDNVDISRRHTRLVFGMLLRLPRLLWRKIA